MYNIGPVWAKILCTASVRLVSLQSVTKRDYSCENDLVARIGCLRSLLFLFSERFKSDEEDDEGKEEEKVFCCFTF